MDKHLVILKRRAIAQGFTLLEVMIGMLIFSIGLLGLASMQMASSNLTSDSHYRTIAVILANDMLDRMRANVSATNLGLTSPYNNPNGIFSANPSCLGLNGSGGAATGAQCTPVQMAGEDFYEWYANIAGATAASWWPAINAQLPGGSGVVCIDSTPNDGSPSAPGCDNVITVPGKPVFAIKIWWLERKDENTPGVQHQYVTSFSL